MASESFNTGVGGWHEPLEPFGRTHGIACRSASDISLMTSELSRLLERQSKLLEAPLLGPYLLLYDQQSEEIQNLFFRIIASEAQLSASYRIRDLSRNPATSPAIIPSAPNRQMAQRAKSFSGSIRLFATRLLVGMYEAIVSLTPHAWHSQGSNSDNAAPLRF